MENEVINLFGRKPGAIEVKPRKIRRFHRHKLYAFEVFVDEPFGIFDIALEIL